MKHKIGWVNVYKRKDGSYMVTQIPKKTREECLEKGLLHKASSKYLGTVQVYV